MTFFITGDKVAAVEPPIDSSEKTIKVLKEADENDSEPFPALISVENFKSLVSSLLDLLELRNEEDKQIHLIVNQSRILDTKMLRNDTTFAISSKSKTNLVKIYLDKV